MYNYLAFPQTSMVLLKVVNRYVIIFTPCWVYDYLSIYPYVIVL